MKKVGKIVGKVLALVFAVIFVTGCFFYANGVLDHMERGQNLQKAAGEAAAEIREFMADIWQKTFPAGNDDNVVVLPLANANISWNCLNKK